MRPQTPISRITSISINELLKKTKSKSDFQRVQALWLRVEFGMDAANVAKITNLTAGTVRKIWSNYLKNGEGALIGKDRGGRRNCHLSEEEEKIFLAPFFKRAEAGNMLIVAEIQAAYEEVIEKKVPKSTIYRLLARHGWKRNPIRVTSEEAYNQEKPHACNTAISKGDPTTGRHSSSKRWPNTVLHGMIKEMHQI